MLSDYQHKKFGDLLIGGTRNGVYKPKEFHGRGDKIVNMGELFSHRRLFDIPMKRVELNENEKKNSRLQQGDLIFARRSLTAEGAGKCSIVCAVSEPTTFESSIIRARPDPKLADSLYLYYFFGSSHGTYKLDTIKRSVAVSGITGGDLVELQIPVPSLPIQKAIAATLGALDDKIELNRRMNVTLEAMARALFKSWFVDFDPVRAKMEGRQPFGMDSATAALFPSRLAPFALGDIPEGWSMPKFSALFDIIGGGTPKTVNEEYWNGDIPWFSVVDAPSDTDVFVLRTNKTITQKGADESSTRILPAGTTIISARGTVGRLALVGRPMAMNQSCYGLSPVNGIGPAFLYFSTRKAVAELQSHAHGSVFDTITRDTFDGLTAIKPTDAVATAFEVFAWPMLEKIRGNLVENLKLERTRDYLLPKLISGDIRIPDAEKLVEAA